MLIVFQMLMLRTNIIIDMFYTLNVIYKYLVR